MNREFTVPELKKLLAQKEVIIADQESKIKILTNKIKELGGVVPDEKAIMKAQEAML